MDNGHFLLVKWAHVILVIIAWFVTCILAYASVKFQGDQNTKDIQELKTRTYLPREEYERRHSDLINRTDRLERYIDEQQRSERHYLGKP